MKTLIISILFMCAFFSTSFGQSADANAINENAADELVCGWKNTTYTDSFGATCVYIQFRGDRTHYACAVPIQNEAAECKKIDGECIATPVTPEQEIEMHYRLCSRRNLNVDLNAYNCVVWFRPPANVPACARVN
jgi:hypothetical protein